MEASWRSSRLWLFPSAGFNNTQRCVTVLILAFFYLSACAHTRPVTALSACVHTKPVTAPELAPLPKQSIPSFPFVDQKELDKLYKVFTEKEMPKRDRIAINTDDRRYLTYMLGLKRRIELIWQYPPQAAASGLQGDLLLNFTICQDGQLADVALVRSSGHRILDEAAIHAVRSASPYAPLPESWHQDRITITGSFIYYGSHRDIQ